MAKFKVNDIFSIKSRNYLVVSGEIESGSIDKGMVLYVKHNGDNVKLPIDSINFVQSRTKENPSNIVALCIKIENKKILDFSQKNIKIGETYYIRSLQFSFFETLKNKLSVTSFQTKTVMHAKILNQNNNLIPGVLYTFKLENTKDELIAFYTKKDDKYYTFSLIESHVQIDSGSTITQESALLPQEV